MKIAVITDSIDKGPISIGKYTKNLVRKLLDTYEGKKVEIILIHGEKKNIDIYKKTQEVIIPFFKRRKHSFFLSKIIYFILKIIHDLVRITKIIRFCKKERICILHIPHLAGSSAPSLGYLLLKKHTKLVVTLHGVAPLAIPPKLFFLDKDTISVLLKVEVFKWKYLLRNKFEIMITVSHSEKKNIIKNLNIPPEKIKVIYHGVNDNFKPLKNKKYIREKLKEKYKIKFPFIFHISGYQPKKNVEGIIKAFAICKKKYKIKEKLVIGGKQPEHLKALSKKLGIEKDVIFTGYIYEKDLPLFYNAAETFIFPSFHESFGMPILEAMACGCPVITSNIFSLPEVAGKAAIFVDPHDPGDIAMAIYKVVSDKKLKKKLSRWGVERAKKFTWKRCAKFHLNVYWEVSKNERFYAKNGKI